MLLDLAQPFFAGMPQGGALDRPFCLQKKEIPSKHASGGKISVSYVDSMSHVGTHMDAPNHFVPGAPSISEVKLERVVGECVFIDLARDEPRPIGRSEIEAGAPEILKDDIVFVRTGWGRYFTQESASRYLEHPYFLPEVALWLVEVGIKLFGTDTISPDPPPTLRSETYPMDMHVNLLSAGIPIVENLNLESTTSGARGTAYAFPLNLLGCDGAPVRVVAELRNP